MEGWELPEGWETGRIGDCVIDVTSGFACAKKHAVPDGLPHLRPFNVGTKGELDLSDIIRIPEDFRAGVERYHLEAGDILFNNTNSVKLVGKAAIVREPMRCAFSNHITRLRVDRARLMPEWLVLSLRQLWANGFFASRCRKWIGQAGFNSKMLVDVEISLPSLDEQRRIVARVEELFARIEEARGLRAAADQDAERLMSAALEEIFREAETKGWPIKTVGNVIEGKPQYGTSQKASWEPVGVPILRMGNIVDGQVSFDSLKYINLPPDEEAKYLLREGDILFNRTNSAELVGKSAVYPGGRRAVFASYLIRIVADCRKALPHFIVSYINSPLGRQYIQSQLTRAIGQVNVNAKKLQAMPIPVPPLPEQRRIVEYLSATQAQVAELQRQQGESAAELERLSRVVLAQAFQGEL